MKLGFYGATGTVTGSKYLVEHGGQRILIDCGLFQGYKQLRLRNWSPPPFDPARISAVVLTHAHLDHSGYIPLLVKQGFRGPILCTEGTYDLCRILLPDSGHIQEEDAARANRRGYSKHHPALPLYTREDALHALGFFRPLPLHENFEPAPGLSARFLRAGHILGSAMVRLQWGRRSILFTGDLGRPADLIMKPPEDPEPADYLVIESTYGDRRHSTDDPLLQLAEVIRRVSERRGVIVMPCFAVGRTQAVLWSLHELKAAGNIPASLPVFLNSPMAQDVTDVFAHHADEHVLSAAQCSAMCRVAHYVREVEESKLLNDRRGPMIIIAGSGMATGGRVVHHLKAFCPDPANCVVFTGYQAGGTRGAAMLAGAEMIKIHGLWYPVRCESVQLDNYSAHADYAEILAWLKRMPDAPQRVFITHGEPPAADALRVHIQDELGWSCTVPDYRDQVSLGRAS